MLSLARRTISQNVSYMPIFNITKPPISDKVERCLIIGDSSPHKKLKQMESFLKFLCNYNIEYVFVGYQGLLNSDGSVSRWLNNEDYTNLLAKSKYVFIQSDFESLGIPFIESSLAGCVLIVPKSFPLIEELVDNIYDIDKFKQSIIFQRKTLPSTLLLTDYSDDFILLIKDLLSIKN